MSSQMTGPAELAERALAGAGTAGRLAIVEESYSAEVRFANNTVTTNGVRRQRNVTLVSFESRAAGIASGVASASGALPVGELVRLSRADAAGSEPAEDAFELVGPEANDADFATAAPDTDLGRLEPVLSRLNDLFARAESSNEVRAGFARHEVTTTYLASSTGLRRRFSTPSGRVELVGRAADGSRSAWAGTGTNDFSDVDLEGLEARVARGLRWAGNKVELPAGRYETLLPPDAVADLVLMLDEFASGRQAEEGRNVFSAPSGKTRVGEKLFDLPFDLYGDPADARFPTPPFVIAKASTADASVFDNGVATSRVDMVRHGVLRRLRYHRAGAARSAAGGTFTPNLDNLVLELPGASANVDEMVGRTERGLLLTCLWYIRPVDPATLLLTGLTRDGVYLIDKGEVVGAVNNFRFNESPLDMLRRTAEAGSTERCLSREWGEWLTRSAMPPLRVDGFNMSSVSPAT